MIQPICSDPLLLSRKSRPATVQDLATARDLLDTLCAHREECVGMAANMIGVSCRVIVFDCEGTYCTMLNPEIIRHSERYSAEEGCLSLAGKRTAIRWRTIKVRYHTVDFQQRVKTFTGWTAQIIQHEIDHCDGILI